MIKIEVVNSLEDLNKLEPVWNSLLAKSESNTIFLTHEWITTWWKSFHEGKELSILVAKDEEDIVGIAPLMILDHKLFQQRIIQFIGTPMADYCDFIISNNKEDVLKSIYDYLFNNKQIWNRIVLHEIPEKSSTILFSRKVLNGRYFSISFDNKCLSLNIKKESAESLSKMINKKDMKEHKRKLIKQGEQKFIVVKEVDDAMKILESLFSYHERVWSERRGTPSMFTDKKVREFFKNLTKELFEKGKIGLLVAYLNTHPIAIQFGMHHNNTFLSYCRAYDMQYAKYGPGLLLGSHIIDHYSKNGFSNIDFSRGQEQYKFRFSNNETTNLGVTINKNVFDFLSCKYYGKLKKYVMSHSAMHKFLNKYKQKIMHLTIQKSS